MIIETAGLISIAKWFGTKISDKGFDSVHGILTKSDNFNKKFYKIVEKTSKILNKKYPTVLGGDINYFFKNENVFNELIKLLFVNSEINIKIISNLFDIQTLPPDFLQDYISTLREELLKDQEFNQILANKELFVIVHGISENLNIISEKSNLAVSEIILLRKILSERLGSIFNYEEFLDLYSRNAIHNLSQVNFIGLGVDLAIKRKRKNLQDVFVKPYFELTNNSFKLKQVNLKRVDSHFEDNEIISYSKIFEQSDKIVILGNPGSGKSVLVKSLICDLIESNKSISFKVFPLRIELRKYLSYKKNQSGNIQKYIITLLENEYGISNITNSILDNIFKNYTSYVFFDGLDEIFKIEDKIEIKNDIEIFHHLYAKVKSITTSRIIGYEEAKLQEDVFCELTILRFDTNQIEEYIKKWYDKEEDNKEIRNREIEGFLTKMHEIDGELISNPLLLSLIVILYRNILKLPESKLEIYQSCTKTLVDKWDASKDLVIDLDSNIYKIKEKILADLAYWQYEQLSSEAVSISYDKAKQMVGRSITEKLYVDDDLDSQELAENFMLYAQKRSIYFDNNFTHKTFLEYYTAYWIYSNIEKKHKIDKRNEIITKYINNSFWHIVLELLLNMIDKDQADSEIMDELIDLQLKNKGALPFLLSTVNSFKNISREIIIKTIDTSIEQLVGNQKKHTAEFIDRGETEEFKIYEGIKNLYTNGQENFIKEKFKKLEKDNYVDIDNVYVLHLELTIFHSQKLEIDIFDEKTLDNCINTNSYLYLLNSFLDHDKDILKGILRFINNFGIEALFIQYSAVYDIYNMGDYFSYYLNGQINPNNINNISKNLTLLENFGLKKDRIFNYIKQRSFYFATEETIRSIGNHLVSENDLYTKKILLIIFFLAMERTNTAKFRKLLNEFVSNDLISQINNIKSIKKKIQFIERLV